MMDGLLGWYDLGPETRIFSETDPEPFGANFAFRRSLADQIGLMRSDLGKGGDCVGYGEETEFIRRARNAGAQGIYVGTAHCEHLVDRRRFALRALYGFGVAKGLTHRAMTDPTASGSSARALLFLAHGVRQLLLGRGDRFRQCVIHAGVERGLMLSARAVEHQDRPSDDE